MELVEQLLQEKVRSFLDIGVKPGGNDPSQLRGNKVGREASLRESRITGERSKLVCGIYYSLQISAIVCLQCRRIP